MDILEAIKDLPGITVVGDVKVERFSPWVLIGLFIAINLIIMVLTMCEDHSTISMSILISFIISVIFTGIITVICWAAGMFNPTERLPVQITDEVTYKDLEQFDLYPIEGITDTYWISLK